MRIEFIEIQNYRRLKSVRIDIGQNVTVLVGANNSGKTSAIRALQTFLMSPQSLSLHDLTISNWLAIDAIGEQWEGGSTGGSLDELLPQMDIWLWIEDHEKARVQELIPNLDWSGGLLGIRLAYQVLDLERLRDTFLARRGNIKDLYEGRSEEDQDGLNLWPANLTDFLLRELHSLIKLVSFLLDPELVEEPNEHGEARPQALSGWSPSIKGQNPLRGLIRIDEIVAQRDFRDAGTSGSSSEYGMGFGSKNKQKLSDQLRAYFDRHLDPDKEPTSSDLQAIKAIQQAERIFNDRLTEGFSDALSELEQLGYPGLGSPGIEMAVQLKVTDGLRHESAVRYTVLNPGPSAQTGLTLPEDYSGLGFQNLIAMAFLLMRFRDDWMQVGKAKGLTRVLEDLDTRPLIHLVIVEEPEAHLHAQVQQVFINKAYGILRYHKDLVESDKFETQLIVSTHSGHIAHETDFGNLRYFRRHHDLGCDGSISPISTVVNLTRIFESEDEKDRFVETYLKVTHSDLFFADAAVLVEGQAEMVVIPHIIRQNYKNLLQRYIALINIGGSYAYRFRKLIEALGITTLVIADLDSKILSKNKNGDNRWKATTPARGMGQETDNQVLSRWHPKLKKIDSLLDFKRGDCATVSQAGAHLYVAFQQALPGKPEIIPRTFEVALVLENITVLQNNIKLLCDKKLRKHLQNDSLKLPDLNDQLHDWVRETKKTAFSLDCLKIVGLNTPTYIAGGLDWLAEKLETGAESLKRRAGDENGS